MKKLGILVGEKGDWKFFREIFNDLDAHFRTIVFKENQYNTPLLYGRLNRWAFHHGIRSVLKQSDVCFFEWASELLVEATQMPKYCPIVTRLHSYELFAWAPKINWDKVDKVILVSRAMQEKFIQEFPDQAPKTVVIYNALPLDKFKPIPRDFHLNLGMLSSINPRKRIYEIIIMIRDLKHQGINAHLHIAGGRVHGPDFDEYFVAIRRLVQKLGLQENITFYDYVTDTPGWLQNIDIFISNSYWEGHQVALIEAMASGCYCLSHFWDGAEEVLPAENLYATDLELQNKIIEYINITDEEKRRHQTQMRNIACEKYDVDRQKVLIRRIITEIGDNSNSRKIKL